ncbi:MAG: PTS sugar transporter subunit IIA [Alphaproteobacteria bacterium GM7ARS4]|nr:PTS sugar transporter subunit IIA [Alphaproteobacteria bacterium GM7ARS4]
MALASLIPAEQVFSQVRVASKKQLFDEVALRMASYMGCAEQTILDVLLERERLGSTSVGNGMAIPHGKIDGIERIYGLLMTLEHAIDFDAHDGQHVDIVCALIAPADEGGDHLRALSVVSRFLRDKNTSMHLRNAKSHHDIIALLGSS